MDSYVDNFVNDKHYGEELFRNIVLLENKEIVNKIPKYEDIVDLLSNISTDQKKNLKNLMMKL